MQREVMLCMSVPVCWGYPDRVLAETLKVQVSSFRGETEDKDP